VALICLCNPQPDINLCCETTDMRLEHYGVPIYTPAFIIHKGMARLRRPGWRVMYRDNSPTERQPIHYSTNRA